MPGDAVRALRTRCRRVGRPSPPAACRVVPFRAGDSMKRFAAPIALLFLCTGPAPSQAAWTTDPLQNTPVCLAPGNQRFPIMTPDGQGGAFIVFRDTRDSATALGDLYAQHLDSQGNLLWASGGVPVTTMPGEQFAAAPAIAVDGVGGAFVSFATGPNPQGGPFWVK